MYIVSQRNPLFSPITWVVIALHMLLIFWVTLMPSQVFQPPKSPNRLIVKTVQLQPHIKPVVIESLPEIEKEEQLPQSVPSKVNFKDVPPLDPPMEKRPPLLENSPPAPQIIEKTVQTPREIVKPSETKKIEAVKKVEPVKTEPVKKQEIKKTPVQKQNPLPKKIEKKTEPVSVKKSQVTEKQPANKISTKENPKVESRKAATPDKKPATPPNDKPTQSHQDAKVKAEQEALQEQQRKLIAAAQESMAKMEKGRANLNTVKSNLTVVAPVAIKNLQIEALPDDSNSMTVGEKSYRDELAARLKLLLKLPEHGDVQLKLTLDRNGKVLKVTVTKSLSPLNRSYIEKNLPTLKFPSFGKHFDNKPDYTFNIQLSNDL